MVLTLLAILLVLTPLFLHEAGHWAVLRRFNVPLTEYWIGLGPCVFKAGRARIGMFPIGGAVVPSPEQYARLTNVQKLLVAAAGPAASLISGLIVLLSSVLVPLPAHHEALESLAILNFWIAGINLLPIPPLDGFKILTEALSLLGRPLMGHRVSMLERMGSGLVYGVGFLVLLKVFLP